MLCPWLFLFLIGGVGAHFWVCLHPAFPWDPLMSTPGRVTVTIYWCRSKKELRCDWEPGMFAWNSWIQSARRCTSLIGALLKVKVKSEPWPFLGFFADEIMQISQFSHCQVSLQEVRRGPKSFAGFTLENVRDMCLENVKNVHLKT